MSAKEFEESLKFIRLALLICGIRMEPGKWDTVIKVIFNINFVWYYTDIVGELYWFVDGIRIGTSFLELTFVAPCAAIAVLGSIKVLYFYIHQDTLIEVVNKLKSIHPAIDKKKAGAKSFLFNDVVEKNVKVSTKYVNTLVKLDFGLCLPVFVAFLLLPVSRMGYEYWTTGTYAVAYPVSVKYFFDPYDKTVWPFVYLHILWSTIAGFIYHIGTDSFFVAFCVYMRMHFRILQRSFQDAIRKNERRLFIEVVQRHQDLIHLADQVEILYSKATLINIVTSSIIICLCAFNVTSVNDLGMVISFLALLVMSLTQIFLVCYFGDMLMKSSVEITDAVYNSTWYQADQRMKRNVLFVMTRSRKPCKLTAARFADVNLITFTTILSRSWSLFALLKTVYK